MASKKANGAANSLKPKIRRKSKEPMGKTVAKPDNLDIENELDELDAGAPVVVRERERGPSSPPGERPSSRLGRFIDQTKEATKEHVKRPLSGLLKRPGSRSGSRERGPRKEAAEEGTPRDRPGSAKPLKKGGLFEKNRPGSAFGRKIFGRKSKDKSGDAEDEDFLDGSPPRLGASGMIELEDSEPRDEPRGSYGGGGDSPDIPTLEEAESLGGGLGAGVAMAPSVAVNRVASYKELDNELMKQAAFASLGDIDLSLLTRFLCPEAEVREEEVAWSWDYLYTSVCSELRQEWEEADEEDEEPGVQNRIATDVLGSNG